MPKYYINLLKNLLVIDILMSCIFQNVNDDDNNSKITSTIFGLRRVRLCCYSVLQPKKNTLFERRRRLILDQTLSCLQCPVLRVHVFNAIHFGECNVKDAASAVLGLGHTTLPAGLVC